MLEDNNQSDYSTISYAKDLVAAEKICSGQTRCCFESAKKLTASPCCCVCARKRHTSFLTSLGICIIVLFYTLMGALIFFALEGNAKAFLKEDDAVAASKPNLNSDGFEIRAKVVERLWSITEDLNILYKENWTKLAAKELLDFQKMLFQDLKDNEEKNATRKLKWSLSNSFLYSLTLITTIGCGTITPKTALGKIVSLLYAFVGIPITMSYLSYVGGIFSRAFKSCYTKIRPQPEYEDIIYATCPYNANFIGDVTNRSVDRKLNVSNNMEAFRHRHWVCRDHTRVPIYYIIIVMLSYIAFGMFMFNKSEKWSYLDGCYFSFLSLSTIGFGALSPGEFASTKSPQMADIAVGLCCFYLFIGVLVIGVGFKLIQEEIRYILKDLSNFCSGRHKSNTTRAGKECTCIKDDKASESVL